VLDVSRQQGQIMREGGCGDQEVNVLNRIALLAKKRAQLGEARGSGLGHRDDGVA
jgi:hypothetical protein